jgi:hypothetical protein
MDFNRSGQPRPAAAPAAATTVAPQKVNAAPEREEWKKSRLYRISFVALLISATVLFIALIFYIVFGPPINREARYVDGSKYQAVFVNVNGTNGGQVYFGKVTALTPQYIRLANVFYIQNQAADGQATSSSYNLVKLGCELHGPTDEMLINRSQVFFWENLKADSQVAQKAAEFYKQNPNGQKCSTTSNSTQQSNATTQTPASTTTTPPAAATPPAATTPPATTKKP